MKVIAEHPPGGPSSPRQPATLLDLLVARLDDKGGAPALATLPREDAPETRWTWLDLAAAAVDVARRLEAAGLGPRDRVVHVGTHTVDWVVVDLACLLAGVVHVPLHADASGGEILRQIEWLAPRGLVASGAEGPLPPSAAGPVLGAVGDPRRVLDLRFFAPRPGLRHRLPTAGLHAEAWRALRDDPAGLRREVARRAAAADPDAPAKVFLSSGTTGHPRGYVHSQRSLALNALAAAEIFLGEPDDVRLAWLPLSHALASTGDVSTALVRGGCLNVVPDRRRILDACGFLPPTVILGVPAFFDRLAGAAEAGRIADLRGALGGRVRVCVSGGAALRRRTSDAFAARGIPLVEGYGLAEAGPVVTLATPRDHVPGSVGRPLPGVEVRLGERDELLVRTPSRALEVLVPDGDAAAPRGADDDWIATGDTATMLPDGSVRITGRLVDTLVLAAGTKLPPDEVERALAEEPVVAQVCVCGDGLPVPVALVVPEPGVLRASMRRLGVRVLSRRGALAHPRLLRWVARRLAARQRHLPRSWQVRRVVLLGRPFDTAHGEMTHSMKLKRRSVAAGHSALLEAASASPPAAGVAVVPVGPPERGVRAADGIAGALWGGRAADGGFAAAAEAAAAPLPGAIAPLLEAAERVIAEARAAGTLHDAPLPPARLPAAPLADAPPAPRGMLATAVQDRLGEVGLWGLHVPAAHGGADGSVLDLVRGVTRLAADVPTAAGMLAVHSTIGAVSSVAAFGTEDQRSRLLPALAAGRPLSVFGATEPEAGCDLGAVRTTLSARDGRLVLDGTKMFITNATWGRLVKLLVSREGKPAVVLARLPDRDTEHFRLLPYALHPLRHTPNHALEFRGFEIDERDILTAPGGDAMAIVWHGLDRGRCTLAAQAAGTLRLLCRHAARFALERVTWGRPIATRQLVQGRLARIAAGVLACEALSTWAADAVDRSAAAGVPGGDLEAITAKVVAGAAVREAAVDALGVHGGRAFLVGHPLGDAFHDHFAVGVYEGESDLLGLALFKGLSRRHPLAARLREGGKARAAAGWLAWRVARLGGSRGDAGILDRRLRDHARAARAVLGRTALSIDRAIRRHGRGLGERQLEIGALSGTVRDAASVLAVAHTADVRGDAFTALLADVWCRTALSRAVGRRLSPADHAAVARLGSAVADNAEGGGIGSSA